MCALFFLEERGGEGYISVQERDSPVFIAVLNNHI